MQGKYGPMHISPFFELVSFAVFNHNFVNAPFVTLYLCQIFVIGIWSTRSVASYNKLLKQLQYV